MGDVEINCTSKSRVLVDEHEYGVRTGAPIDTAEP